jgi:hypothetical protein
VPQSGYGGAIASRRLRVLGRCEVGHGRGGRTGHLDIAIVSASAIFGDAAISQRV